MSRGGEFSRKRERNLRCAECGREQTLNERGGRSYVTTDEHEPAEAIVYCPRVRQARVRHTARSAAEDIERETSRQRLRRTRLPERRPPAPAAGSGSQGAGLPQYPRPRARPQPDRRSRVASAPERRPRAPVREGAEPSLGRGSRSRRPPRGARCTSYRQSNRDVPRSGWLAPRRAPRAIPSATAVGTVDGHLIRRRALCPPTRAASAPLRTTSHR
jgi:hypothetical protein